MSILDSIKSDKQMSLRHWRYLLLHWCFNVKNPDPKAIESTGLPRFLYTHYCPLFHLTNLIAILSPLILLIKILKVLIVSLFAAADSVKINSLLNRISVFVKRLFHIRTSQEIQISMRPLTLEEEKQFFIREVLHYYPVYKRDNEVFTFNKAWALFQVNIQAPQFTQDEARVLYDSTIAHIKKAEALKEAKRKKLRDTLIFWTNFSRFFIKWIMYALYGAIAIGVFYLLYIGILPAVSAIGWVFQQIGYLFTNEGTLTFLIYLGKGILYLGLITLVIYFLLKWGFLQRFFQIAWPALKVVGYPFYLVGVFFSWVGDGFKAVREFITLFYEENCPAIVLVSKEEEDQIEQEVERAV